MSDIENKTATVTAGAQPQDAAPVDAAKGAEIMEKFEKESRTRSFSKEPLKSIVYYLCLAFTLYQFDFAFNLFVIHFFFPFHPLLASRSRILHELFTIPNHGTPPSVFQGGQTRQRLRGNGRTPRPFRQKPTGANPIPEN